MRGRAVAQDVYYNELLAENARIDFDLSGLPKTLIGQASIHVDTAVVGGVALDTVGGVLRFSDLTHATFEVGALSKNGPSARAGGTWSSLNGANDVLLSSARFTIGAGDWNLASAARIHADSNVISVDSLLLRRDSATIALRGTVPDTGAASGELRALRVPLRDLGVLAQLADTVDGLGDLTVTVGGTKLAPVIDASMTLSSVKWSGLDIPISDADAHFRDKRLAATGKVFLKGQPPILATASLPLDVTLFSAAWGHDSMSALVTADSADLSVVQALVGQDALHDIGGRIKANVGVRGTPQAKIFEGDITVTNGTAFVVASGVQLSNIAGRLHGVTNSAGIDSTGINLVATTGGKPTGSATVNGWIKNLVSARPEFNIALGLNQFHALNRKSLADLYISTVSSSDSVRLTGTLDVPKLSGSLLVDKSSIYLPDPVIARKQPVIFASDDSVGRVGRIVGGSAMFSELMYNLTSSVPIRLGNDVRLRSNEANVRLSGELHVAKSSLRGTRTLATGDIVPGLTLEGALITEGGTYNLNLGIVQREFQVLSGGTVTFTLADSWKNPTLDIKARHTVKQPGGDLGVIVNLHGPLIPYPDISLSASGVDYDIAPSDLLSYLLIGKPGFDFLQNSQTSQVLASVVGPTVSAFASDRIRALFGSPASMLQLQLGGTGGTETSGGSRSSLQQALYGSTLVAEQQFGQNLFLGVNTGFCQFAAEGNAGRLNNAFTNLGAKVEWRVAGPKLAVQLAYDPSTEARSCGNQSTFGLVRSPPNFSFSLSHVWRF
jgi:hypothetical protein